MVFFIRFRWLFFNHLFKTNKKIINGKMKTLSTEEQRCIKSCSVTLLGTTAAHQTFKAGHASTKAKWSLFQSKVKTTVGGFRKAMTVQLKIDQHSKLQNLQSHLFRFSLQMWRDAKNKEGKQEDRKNDHMNQYCSLAGLRRHNQTLCVRMWFGKARWKHYNLPGRMSAEYQHRKQSSTSEQTMLSNQVYLKTHPH